MQSSPSLTAADSPKPESLRQDNRSSTRKFLLAILLAIVCGTGIGAGAGVLKFRQNPWQGGIGAAPIAAGGVVGIDAEEFDFGRKEFTEDGLHEFTVTNRGDSRLILRVGQSSCSCTVSELAKSELSPGESTKVRVSWRSKHHTGPFGQTVTILTTDPHRPEVVFKIKGEFFQSVYADPDELTFNQITGSDPVTKEVRVFSSLPGSPITIVGHEFTSPAQGRFFDVDSAPLPAEQLPKENGIKSGVLVHVTVKPGLPLGRFLQTIDLNTNLMDRAVKVNVFGSVGEVTLVGPGWSSEAGVLEVGTLDGRQTAQRRLIVISRGPSAGQMKFKVARVEPDFLKVTVGEPKLDDTGQLSQTELLIEIPDSKAMGKRAPADYLGRDNGRLGEILLETTTSPPHSLPIRVRFLVLSGT
jgi:hypothetical protein